MTPYEREILIRTIMGEAANEGPEGWAAVAHVIKNRATDPRWPGDPAAVALQPKQFSAWNDKSMGGNDLVHRGPDSPKFQQIGAVVDDVWQGEVPDPTGGATHYYAPAGMPGGRAPKWFPNVTQERGDEPVTIGGHIFSGRVSGQPRRPHAQTPGVDAPEYEADSPYFRAPSPEAAQVIPLPRAKPEPEGFDWQSAMGGAGGILGALGGGQQDAQQAAQALQAQRELEDAQQRRQAWHQSFGWL